MVSTIDDWANLLTAVAASAQTPAPTDPHAVFADESGHRRPVDRPFLAWLDRENPPPESVSALTHSAEPDVALWAALATGQTIPAPVLEMNRRDRWRSTFDSGSLFPQRNAAGPIAIEVWSEVELSSLHALARMADAQPDLRPLVRSTSRWLIENLQPDNATNHPWSVHVFAAIGVLDDNVDALLYAQTLLHNCQVSQGRPDAFSALILRDSADALRTGTITRWIAE